jgi:crossover junction endodeoxyribonuclease RuvC
MVVRMFVMGIDPGLSRCGYAVVEARREGHRAAAIGVLTTAPSTPLPVRLVELQREVRLLIAEYRPAVVAVERVLFQVNVRTAMSVGQASGVAMAEAAAVGCEVVEYSPNQVKNAVAGWGGASKEQVQRMVQTLLRLPRLPEPPDAADAAALALTHLAVAPSLARAKRGGSEATDPSRSEVRRRLPGLTRLDASAASENEEGRQPVSRPGDEAGRKVRR